MLDTSTDRQARDGQLLAVIMAATVIWNLYGFATGFFQRAWRRAPLPVTPISYLLNAAIAACLPFVRRGTKTTTLAATGLGALMALWSAGGFLRTPPDVRLAPQLPGRAATAVPALLGALIAVLGFDAYRR
jgi:hypothetical protein